ncbi:hypothetical protein [Methylobacterium sp. E-045]|uniref:hypothetical protein n=1 Tax=Methylobacterium sp. E-045 TaxID=2836575 RepID=UPI001FB866B0|nr:hypothetical protein [Methylobacterium sp. E-045]MCJ2129290.1 hypothetical protein [Methylobacterium sp. E-045]
MADSRMVTMTVAIPGTKPGIAQAAKALGVKAGAIDRSFGVIAVDPRRNLYAVQVRASAIASLPSDGPFQGPFSNPKIAPFGPPVD